MITDDVLPASVKRKDGELSEKSQGGAGPYFAVRRSISRYELARSSCNLISLLDQSLSNIAVAIGQNQPLLTSQEMWTTEVAMTEGQLRGKRDTFWETAPAYDGRREIWDALKAACEAVDVGDYDLAQAIVDGANISLPTG